MTRIFKVRPRFSEFTVQWNGEEFVARCPKVLDVSGHSREPVHALKALTTKLAELFPQPRGKRKLDGCAMCGRTDLVPAVDNLGVAYMGCPSCRIVQGAHNPPDDPGNGKAP